MPLLEVEESVLRGGRHGHEVGCSLRGSAGPGAGREHKTVHDKRTIRVSRKEPMRRSKPRSSAAWRKKLNNVKKYETKRKKKETNDGGR